MPTETIKVLSVRQPYADEIIFGDRWCENRTWETRYRGPLYIHASRWDGPSNEPTPGNGEIGSIIGRVELVDVVNLDEVPLAKLKKVAESHGLSTSPAGMEHVLGDVCFLLTNPTPLFEPIRCKGKLNVWEMDVDSSRLQFGQPEKVQAERSAPRERSSRFSVGSKVNYRRVNFYVVAIDEDEVGIAKSPGGQLEDWIEKEEIKPGWF